MNRFTDVAALSRTSRSGIGATSVFVGVVVVVVVAVVVGGGGGFCFFIFVCLFFFFFYKLNHVPSEKKQ